MVLLVRVQVLPASVARWDPHSVHQRSRAGFPPHAAAEPLGWPCSAGTRILCLTVEVFQNCSLRVSVHHAVLLFSFLECCFWQTSRKIARDSLITTPGRTQHSAEVALDHWVGSRHRGDLEAELFLKHLSMARAQLPTSARVWRGSSFPGTRVAPLKAGEGSESSKDVSVKLSFGPC